MRSVNLLVSVLFAGSCHFIFARMLQGAVFTTYKIVKSFFSGVVFVLARVGTEEHVEL